VKIRNVVARRGVALAAAVLTLGLSAGAAASATLTMAGRDASAAEFELRAAHARHALDTTFQRYADTMHALVAAAAVRPDLTASIAGDRLPGAQQVLVVGADYAVLAHHSAAGAPPPAARLVPAPPLARALELSRASGRIVATPAHVLMPDMTLPPAHRQPAFELAAPVHHDAFRGWVVVGVRAVDLLDAALHELAGVSAVLTETSPDGVSHEVARWPAGAAATGGDQDAAGRSTGDGSGPQRRLEVALAGHAWQVLVRPTTPLISAARTAAAPLTMLGAALVSLLLAAIVLVADAGRGRALALARRAVDHEAREVERARRAEQAMRERDAELAGFASAAGESLHSPLHTIAGYTDLLLEDTAPELDPASRGFLERIGASTRRMLGIVGELLEYTAASNAALKPEPVDTERLALDVAAGQLDTPAGERPSIDVGELPLVTADSALIRQMLDHLIGNAVRFVRHGAAARVTVGARELPDGWWRIEVADRGIGVPEEQRERIFAPFHRAPAAEGYPGSGLGLAVCKQIVALHGGEIGVEANPGGGSVFWFTVSATGVTLSLDELSTLAAA
jgi:signal transduction histidine kinase